MPMKEEPTVPDSEPKTQSKLSYAYRKIVAETKAYIQKIKASMFGSKATKRSWQVSIKEGKATLPTPTKVGTRPGWRYHSRQVRKALGWQNFKVARSSMKLGLGLGGGQ